MDRYGKVVQLTPSGSAPSVDARSPGRSSGTAGLVQRKRATTSAVQMLRDPVQMSADGGPGATAPRGTSGGNLGGAADAKARQIAAAAAANTSAGAAAGAAAPGGGADAAASTGSVQRQVQFDGDGGGDGPASTDTIHAAAEHGISGGGSSLPHADKIQASFGADFDVSGISAHVGGAAAEACDTMGASAYATGDHVAFGATPDLHTAAHEAAHVVQQKHGVQLYGGVGEVGDSYERHADAVADRVVAGESASDLLSSFAGGGGAGVQQKALQMSAVTGGGSAPSGEAGAAPISGAAPTGGGGGGAGGGGAATPDHFKIELKAWIPHYEVVDPEEIIRASNWLDTLSSSIVNHGPVSLHYEYNSRYRGDNHAGYDGSFRAQSTLEFDWDGTTISGARLSTPSLAAVSHRHHWYRAYIETAWGLGPDIELDSGDTVEAGPVGGGCSGSAAGSSGHLKIAAPNLMTIGPAPAINSDLDFSLSGSTMNLNWLTDGFPSHGYRVYKNGGALKTQVINDASGVNAQGVIGAINLGSRLSSQSNAGSAHAP